VKEQNSPKEIHPRLKMVYGNRAMNERKSIDGFPKFSEDVKLYPIPLDQDAPRN
jgi:hypothetical protein